jgi:hypothetical protein
MNFLPFYFGLPFIVNLTIKFVFLIITSRVLQIEFWNLVCVLSKTNYIYSSIFIKKWPLLNELEHEWIIFPSPLNFPQKIRVDVRIRSPMKGSKMFHVAYEVEPQRDATISSSNMKPVKWVWW